MCGKEKGKKSAGNDKKKRTTDAGNIFQAACLCADEKNQFISRKRRRFRGASGEGARSMFIYGL